VGELAAVLQRAVPVLIIPAEHGFVLVIVFLLLRLVLLAAVTLRTLRIYRKALISVVRVRGIFALH